jgi:uncharacterized protein YdaL
MVVEYISIYAIRFHWYRRILLSNIYNMIEHKFYNLLRLSFHHDWNFQSNSNQWCILDTTDVVLILLKVVLSTNNSSPLIHKCQILTVFCSKKLIDYTYDKKIPQMVERLQVQDPFKTSTRLHSLSFFYIPF